jgi:hypothetical protein
MANWSKHLFSSIKYSNLSRESKLLLEMNMDRGLGFEYIWSVGFIPLMTCSIYMYYIVGKCIPSGKCILVLLCTS